MEALPVFAITQKMLEDIEVRANAEQENTTNNHEVVIDSGKKRRGLFVRRI
jgi:hypothetical protein